MPQAARRTAFSRLGLFVALTLVPLLAVGGVFNSPTVAEAQVASEFIVYEEGFQNGFKFNQFKSGSKDCVVNVLDTRQAATGDFSLATNLNNFCTVILYRDDKFDIDDYDNLEFDVYGLSPSQTAFKLKLASKSFEFIGSSTPIGDYVTVDESWQHVAIPLAVFGVADGTRFRGFRLRDNTNSQGKGNVLFDNIKFVRLVDTDPPTLESASFATSLGILVTFSERVTSTDAVDATNYKITSGTDVNYQTAQTPGIAELQTGSRQVLLTVPHALKTNVSYTVTVNNVRDWSNNPISPDSSADFVVPFLVLGPASVIKLDEIKVSFDEEISEGEAVKASNYKVSSATDVNYLTAQTPLSARLELNERDVVLTLPFTLEDGASYTITVNNVQSLRGNLVAPDSLVGVTVEFVSATLSVDASVEIRPFKSTMRGAQLACWMHEQAKKPGPNDVWNLAELARPLNLGIVRYCGGNWSNAHGWDGTGQAPTNGGWFWTDPDTLVQHPFRYGHSIKPAWIDGLAAFASSIGSQVMIEVNVCDNNPKMWADLVRYANVEKGYNFTYWEIGNEHDLEKDIRTKCYGTTSQTLSAQQYASRYVAYAQAMKAVDPSIKLMGPVTANYFSANTWFPPLVTEMENAGLELDVLSWHWYQLFHFESDPTKAEHDQGSAEALLNYNTALTSQWFPYDKGEVISDPGHHLYRSRRVFAEHTAQNARLFAPSFPNVELAITENNAHGSDFNHVMNGQHLGAVWMADILGRAAYHGLDINIWYELYDGDPNPAETTYGLIYPNKDTNPTRLFIRPTYYSMLMYGQWFGDVLVQSSTNDSLQNTVVWASKDSDDPTRLKLMLVNFNPYVVKVRIDISGFSVARGHYYEMTSADPLNLNRAEADDGGTTSINGSTIDTTLGQVQASIDAIPMRAVLKVLGTSVQDHLLPGYSVTAMILEQTAPTVASVSPSSGFTVGGTKVTITGSDFAPGATVTFGGVAATAVTVVDATTITATTPAHVAALVDIVVTNVDEKSGTLAGSYAFQLTDPTVASVSPSSGLTVGGTKVTITGSDFAPGATVTFGGVAATAVTVVSTTTITATTPAHVAAFVDIVVTNVDGESGALARAYAVLTATDIPAVGPLAIVLASLAFATVLFAVRRRYSGARA